MAEKRGLVKQLSERKAHLKALEGKLKKKPGIYEWWEEEYLDKRDVSLLKSDIADLGIRIKTFSYPQNLGWGVVVLAYLAVFGVLSPVLIIAYQAFFTWAKVFTIVSFWLGIIGIFAYIVFQIRTLRR